MKNHLKNNTLKTILMLVMLALPMLSNHVYGATIFLYKTIFNGNILALFNPNDITEAFYANAIWECFTITLIGIYALIIRLRCDIDTPIKKTLFAIGLVFYLIPHQALLISVCLTILQANDIIEWNILKSWTAMLYIATLVMSLWIYRILVARKNGKLKITLASLSNIILGISAIFPFLVEYSPVVVGVSIGAIVLWLATIADITFEGLAYKTIQKIFTKK